MKVNDRQRDFLEWILYHKRYTVSAENVIVIQFVLNSGSYVHGKGHQKVLQKMRKVFIKEYVRLLT